MNTGRTVFAQVMDFLPLHEFRKCISRYRGHYKVKDFSCVDQFFCMAFAQLTYRESLRDIETCLRSMESKLYHMGIRNRVSKSTLADANERRNWHIYADFAQVLIHAARDLYINEEFGVDLINTVYALDATTIDLCLSVFPWARFRKNKAGIKLHTLLDLRGNIPTFIEEPKHSCMMSIFSMFSSQNLEHAILWIEVILISPDYIVGRYLVYFLSFVQNEIFNFAEFTRGQLTNLLA